MSTVSFWQNTLSLLTFMFIVVVFIPALVRALNTTRRMSYIVPVFFTFYFARVGDAIVYAVVPTLWPLRFYILTVAGVAVLVKLATAEYRYRHPKQNYPKEFVYKRTST